MYSPTEAIASLAALRARGRHMLMVVRSARLRRGRVEHHKATVEQADQRLGRAERERRDQRGLPCLAAKPAPHIAALAEDRCRMSFCRSSHTSILT